MHFMKEHLQHKLKDDSSLLIEPLHLPIVTVYLRLNKKEFCCLGKLQLTELHPNVFKGMVSVIKIHLGGNCLEKLDVSTFKGLRRLEQINLEYNSLTELRQEMFQGLENLKVINLKVNNFKILDLGIFKDLVSLKEINLLGNKLLDIQG